MMNRWGVPLNGRKLERDEDLILFRELHKREKDRVASLLQPVSDEFEPNGGNHALYRIASGKKGSGYDQFFPAENNKNDYDWLKTPPATPLFPSLEMEANAAEVVIQRELPITQPLSRFAGNKELLSNARSNGRPKSPTPKPKIPSRSITPSHRPTISSSEIKDTKPTLSNQKSSQPIARFDPSNNKRRNTTSTTSKPSNQKDNHLEFLTSNLSKNIVKSASKTKPRSRGVSPFTRSTIPVQFPGLSDETPTNLKTNRSTSATRARPQPPAAAASVAVGTVHPKPEPKHRRQSCSPCVTRGRMVEAKADVKVTQILGSRMVEKLMNARKSCAEERDAIAAKHKLRAPAAAAASINETHGFVRMKNMIGKR